MEILPAHSQEKVVHQTSDGQWPAESSDMEAARVLLDSELDLSRPEELEEFVNKVPEEGSQDLFNQIVDFSTSTSAPICTSSSTSCYTSLTPQYLVSLLDDVFLADGDPSMPDTICPKDFADLQKSLGIDSIYEDLFPAMTAEF